MSLFHAYKSIVQVQWGSLFLTFFLQTMDLVISASKLKLANSNKKINFINKKLSLNHVHTVFSKGKTLNDLIYGENLQWLMFIFSFFQNLLKPLRSPNPWTIFGFTIKQFLAIYTLLFCLGVWLFLSNKHQNGWTDRAQFFCGTSRDPKEGSWIIEFSKICL